MTVDYSTSATRRSRSLWKEKSVSSRLYLYVSPWILICEESTFLTYTGLIGELEHLKIETRLIDDKFTSVTGKCVLDVMGDPSKLRVIRKATCLTRDRPTLFLSCWTKSTNIDGVSITSKTHTHPSHSETSRLLTSSLSLGVPVPGGTQSSAWDSCRFLIFSF